MTNKDLTLRERPPIVAIVGHIDHGKSTLLDYIRKTNIVAGEAGGITQHLSAYEAVHETAAGARRITFLDTPGHEAFLAMRSRGLEVADVAILIVSAEDGAKPQTVEALKLIEQVGIPYIVAFTKIDKPTADLERAKMSMLENSVFLEGMGGNIPYIGISSKTGQGIPELLDLILLAAELEGLSADPDGPGSGLVIEANIDNKRGNTATLIVQNGSVRSGEFVVCGETFAPVRIMENFLGKPISEALPGSPIRVIGFSAQPTVGAKWYTVETKKDAERDATAARLAKQKPAASTTTGDEDALHITLPIVIKTDFAGTGDAVVHELEKMPSMELLTLRVVQRGVGPITESDVRLAGSGKNPGLIVGFNVKVEKEARDLAERQGVALSVFDIIYKLTEWVGEEVEKRRPRANREEKIGSAKILKVFSTTKDRTVLGGRIEDGAMHKGDEVKIMRRDVEIGRGEVVSLQSQKEQVSRVEAGKEFGAMVRASIEPAAGDILEIFTVVLK